MFTFIGEVNTRSDEKCPVMESTLYAYADSDLFVFDYTYDPLKTNIDLIDKFLTKDVDVECAWEVRAKGNHYAAVSFEEFQLSEGSSSKHGDVLYIYDGQSREAPLLAELDANVELKESYRSSKDRYLYVVFRQGERTGRRYFHMKYEAVTRSKTFIIKIAAIVSSTVAALGIIFLVFKFSGNCGICRKRCCPDEEVGNEVRSERELRPLTQLTRVPPSAPSSAEDNLRNEAVAAGMGGNNAGRNNAGVAARPQPLTITGGEYEDDGQLTPPPDEPPPSYDDIFGHLDDGDKAK
ncbi:hypothetical protein V1264_009118 [Littorina saxatilis]|uniref:CUB domain-containing protein n=2 Tax=Littorina saxatilis TaxID=31220 RepID=A0AAN9AQS0_9CAEN